MNDVAGNRAVVQDLDGVAIEDTAYTSGVVGGVLGLFLYFPQSGSVWFAFDHSYPHTEEGENWATLVGYNSPGLCEG
jgi:hypothetical protein